MSCQPTNAECVLAAATSGTALGAGVFFFILGCACWYFSSRRRLLLTYLTPIGLIRGQRATMLWPAPRYQIKLRIVAIAAVIVGAALTIIATVPMEAFLAAYGAVLWCLIALSFISSFAVFVSGILSTKYPAAGKAFHYCGFTFGGSIVLLLLMAFLAERAMWWRLRTMPVDLLDGATITLKGETFSLDREVARSLYASIAEGDWIAAHHSSPLDSSTIEFRGDNLGSYVYSIAPDSREADDFWISDLSYPQINRKYDMGQFVSPELTDFLRSLAPRATPID